MIWTSIHQAQCRRKCSHMAYRHCKELKQKAIMILVALKKAGSDFMKTWESYLIASDFMLFSDHQSLQHFKNQRHINKMHARWASYFEQFNFVICHKSGVDNRVPDALIQRVSLLISLLSEIIGLNVWRSYTKRMKTLPKSGSVRHNSMHKIFIF